MTDVASVNGYQFDRYLRYDELVDWISALAAAHPTLVTTEVYGQSHEGRNLWLVTVTDTDTGTHDTKPAHWIDASIHATELTATVAACRVLKHLVDGYGSDPEVTRALQTRTFYVVPRVNPDGAELALADHPKHRRSSARPWPWADPLPGLLTEDVDGNGRLLQMRLPDPSGAWMPHADDARLMVPVPASGALEGTRRYRLLAEGSITDYDGFTMPTPRPLEGLDLNRNYPAGWNHTVPGAGDHPLSEPEIDALARAFVARPNICGFNAFHTSGGVLLRPSSTRADDQLPPRDVWIWKQFGETGEELTGYPAHSVFEDFTWDASETMSGASDDWAYEHRGVYGWTTEFWDIVHAATGEKQSTHFWYTGPSDAEALAVLRWCDEHHPDGYVDWEPFDHPQLGELEIGGWDSRSTWSNPPLHLLATEVDGHAAFAVHQALAAPCLEIVHHRVTSVGDDLWQIEVGVANTGWLPTDVTALARKEQLVLPTTVELSGGSGSDGLEVLDGPARREIGQIEGRVSMRFANRNDGTPDRALVRWTVRAPSESELSVIAMHPRAGRAEHTFNLA